MIAWPHGVSTARHPTYPAPSVHPSITGRVRVDPRLYGHATPRTLALFVAAGYRVVRVGQAAYIASPAGLRWIVGAWDAGDPRPAWADRLDQHHRWLIGRGDPTPLELRREAAWLTRRRRQRLRARSGRFVSAVPWWGAVDAAGRLLTPRAAQPWRLS